MDIPSDNFIHARRALVQPTLSISGTDFAITDILHYNALHRTYCTSSYPLFGITHTSSSNRLSSAQHTSSDSNNHPPSASSTPAHTDLTNPARAPPHQYPHPHLHLSRLHAQIHLSAPPNSLHHSLNTISSPRSHSLPNLLSTAQYSVCLHYTDRGLHIQLRKITRTRWIGRLPTPMRLRLPYLAVVLVAATNGRTTTRI